MKVGSLRKLLVPCLGNPAGTIGVCYDVYTIGNIMGFSFIFPNGNYDGFSEKEIQQFFAPDYNEFLESVADYRFTNVMQLGRDFENGMFDELKKL